MSKLWACYEPDLIQYHEDRANALAVNSEEVTAFLGLMGAEEQNEGILSISDGIAQIQIEGVLSQAGPDIWDQMFGISGTSYVSIIDAIIEAEEDPDVDKIELIMDTPGGEVNGVDAVYQAVATAGKPIVAINTGLLASAGYWIASAADSILADSAVVETGSIGVMVTGIDQSERLEKAGIKVVDIVSDNAPNKAPRVSTEEGVEEIRSRINAIERVFISRVAMGRGVAEETVRETFGRGSVLIADDPSVETSDAISIGMIDSLIYTPSRSSASLTIETPAPVAAISVESKGEKMEENTKIQEELADLQAKHEDLSARVERVLPYLSGSEYPQAIQALAVKVLDGKADPAALEGAIVTFDALKETKITDSAKVDSDEVPEAITQPVDAPKVSDDGVIRSELDYKAAVERTRSNCGIAR